MATPFDRESRKGGVVPSKDEMFLFSPPTALWQTTSYLTLVIPMCNYKL
jgi:hypothetical protein